MTERLKLEGNQSLGTMGQALLPVLGSNDGVFQPFVTAEKGRKAWPMVHKDWLPSNFGHAIISTITWMKSTRKARKNDV